MPEGVQAAEEEEREVAASSHSAEGSVEHKERSSRTAAACRQRDVGLAGSSPACPAAASHKI